MKTGFGMQAAVEDAFGNVVTSATTAVKIALDNNPTGGKLGGTLSETPVNGVATFSGLTINQAGSGYTLQVSSGKLASAITSAITVNSAVNGAQDTITQSSALIAPLVVDTPDFLDTLVTRKSNRST